MRQTKYPVNGAIVLWELAPASSAESVQDAFIQVGLAKFCPKQRGKNECLRSALSEIKGKDQIIQRLKKKTAGMELADVRRGEEENDYLHFISASVDDSDSIVVRNGWKVDRQQLEELYRFNRSILTAGDVGKSLVTLCTEGFAGRTFRSGVYWIHEQHVQHFEDLADLIERAAVKDGTSTISVNWVEFSPRVARDVTMSLTQHVQQEVTRIVEHSFKEVKPETAERLKEESNALYQMVENYSGILESGLENLKNAAACAKKAAVNAAIRAIGELVA